MRILKIAFYFISLLVIVYFGFVFYVDEQLAKKDFSGSYNECHKVWSARGLYGDGIDQNSIESVGAAFAEGAMGVEVDVRYDTKLKDFIVSHDYPYNKKNGKLLLLSELFDAVGESNYFWLDFKRLRHLSEEQTMHAIQRLFEMSNKNGLTDRLYVEGAAPINLAHYQNAGLHTMFDTHPVPESMSFLSALMINLYKILFYFGDHSVMGMDYGAIDDPIYGLKTRERLKNVPVFLYHLPVNEALIDELLLLPAVRVMIIGSNESVNFHSMNACD